MCGRDFLAVLAMLAKLMVGEGELGNIAGLREVHDAGFAQVAESFVP
jgi:hypothetical protein